MRVLIFLAIVNPTYVKFAASMPLNEIIPKLRKTDVGLELDLGMPFLHPLVHIIIMVIMMNI